MALRKYSKPWFLVNIQREYPYENIQKPWFLIKFQRGYPCELLRAHDDSRRSPFDQCRCHEAPPYRATLTYRPANGVQMTLGHPPTHHLRRTPTCTAVFVACGLCTRDPTRRTGPRENPPTPYSYRLPRPGSRGGGVTHPPSNGSYRLPERRSEGAGSPWGREWPPTLNYWPRPPMCSLCPVFRIRGGGGVGGAGGGGAALGRVRFP